MLTYQNGILLPADNRRARGERVDDAARFRALLAFGVSEATAMAVAKGLCYIKITEVNREVGLTKGSAI